MKNAKTGVIPEVIEADYKIDRTVPTGEIRIDERTFWEKFLNAITFGLFYKEPQTVTITAADNSREDVTVEYWLTDEILTVEQLDTLDCAALCRRRGSRRHSGAAGKKKPTVK